LAELAELGRKPAEQRDRLPEDVLAGKVAGVEYIERRQALQQEWQTIIDVERLPLFLNKLELLEELREPAAKEVERRKALAEQKEAELRTALEAFNTRDAEREAMIRTDTELRRLTAEARAPLEFCNQFVTRDDREWAEWLKDRLRQDLGMPRQTEQR